MTWRKLCTFRLHSDISDATKIKFWNAVVRAKILYGMESLQIDDGIKKELDAFHLRGLRQIVEMQTTYGQMSTEQERTNTNEYA